jgi:hypothetical protein
MTMIGKRPKTLREVASRVKKGEQGFDAAVLEFLDSFYAHPELHAAAIREPPELIDALHDAYLSAVAEHLSMSYGLPTPEWTEMQGNDLHEPFFAGGLESLKGILVAESPTAFRRRLLFVSKNALSRPRLPVGDEDNSADPAAATR